MKVVILAGGLGTRLAEETALLPKPMVEIGGRPILWHIMNIYAAQGFDEFVIALGYKGEAIKRYFLAYHQLQNDLTLDFRTGEVVCHGDRPHPWKVHLVDTGLNTQTGGRVKRLLPWLGDEPFMLTYGDGVANVDLKALVDFHRSKGLKATVTAVRPPARFGGMVFGADNRVQAFTEKPQIGEGWINGGFMVVEPSALELVNGDADGFEVSVLEGLAREQQLAAYPHEGFWQCMDTLREKNLLEQLWQNGKAPWRIWP